MLSGVHARTSPGLFGAFLVIASPVCSVSVWCVVFFFSTLVSCLLATIYSNYRGASLVLTTRACNPGPGGVGKHQRP